MTNDLHNNFSLKDKINITLNNLKGISIETDLNPYLSIIAKIRQISFTDFSDENLKQKSHDLGVFIKEGGNADDILPEAFALTAEVIKRVLKQNPYDVQLAAGIVLHNRKLAQMRTGEGKTLAIVFPAYLNALSGEGVHVLTANEYLAGRDAKWMGDVYNFLGLTTGFVHEKMTIAEKKIAYSADITYLTAKQSGFDFLYDNLQYSKKDILMRGFNMAIVDEADFILIDEARIPLVIAYMHNFDTIDPYRINEAVSLLLNDIDYKTDKNLQNCFLTESGLNSVQKFLGCGGSHEEEHYLTHAAINASLHARTLLVKGMDYIIKDDKIQLIDEFTGRIADKRRWPYGIQTALEAKEGLTLEPEGKIGGSITIQNFINLYPAIAALTATAVSAANELFSFYGLNTVVIPPNRPEMMKHIPDKVFLNSFSKLEALAKEIKEVTQLGRPILVGTRSVEESEKIAGLLKADKIFCNVLNARNDFAEAEIIAKAGMPGAVTISTNMAGRGTDIKIGGEEGFKRDEILALGGLYVIGTNRHESIRIDNQLRGRAGRQGDPGSSCFFISLEDDIFRRYGIAEFITDAKRKVMLKEINRAQEIIENQHYVMKKTLRKYSDIVEKQRKVLQNFRDNALLHSVLPDSLLQMCTYRINEFIEKIGRKRIMDIIVQIYLFHIDRFREDYLSFIDTIREGIHLRRYGGQDPLLAFIKDADAEFNAGIRRIIDETAAAFNTVEITDDGVNLIKEGLQGPSGTWTYLINDNPLPLFNLSMIASNNIGFAAAAAFQGAIIFIFTGFISLIKRVFKR